MSKEGRKVMQNQLDNKYLKGITASDSKKIIIFANKLTAVGKLRLTVLHEVVHYYQAKYEGKEKITAFLWKHRDAFSEEMQTLERLYGDNKNHWPQKLFAHVVETTYRDHDYSRIAAVMTTDEEREALDNFINYIEYDKRRVVKETSPDGRAGEGERGVEEGSVQERLRDNDGRGLGSDGRRLTLLEKIGYDRAREEANRRRVWNSRRVRALSEVRKMGLADEKEVSSSADQTQEKLSGYDRESEIQSRRSEADRRRVRNSGELREIQGVHTQKQQGRAYISESGIEEVGKLLREDGDSYAREEIPFLFIYCIKTLSKHLSDSQKNNTHRVLFL